MARKKNAIENLSIAKKLFNKDKQNLEFTTNTSGKSQIKQKSINLSFDGFMDNNSVGANLIDGLTAYDACFMDAKCGSVLEHRYNWLSKTDWTVLPADKSLQSLEIAYFVEKSLRDADYYSCLRYQIEAHLYGFSVVEVLWEQAENGKYKLKSFLDHHPNKFKFRRDKSCVYVHDDGTLLELKKYLNSFLVFSWGSASNPYGRAVGESLYWLCYFKKFGLKHWFKYNEKFAIPSLVGTHTGALTTEQQGDFLNLLKDLNNGAVLVLPNQFKIDLIQTVNSSAGDFNLALKYVDELISSRVLGNVRTTEGGSAGGSYAATRNSSERERDFLRDDAVKIGNFHNRTLVKWIVDNYFGVQKIYPHLNLEAGRSILDTEDSVMAIKTLVDLGLKIPADYIRNLFGFPKNIKDDDEILYPTGNKITEDQEPNKDKDFNNKYNLLEKVNTEFINNFGKSDSLSVLRANGVGWSEKVATKFAKDVKFILENNVNLTPKNFMNKVVALVDKDSSSDELATAMMLSGAFGKEDFKKDYDR